MDAKQLGDQLKQMYLTAQLPTTVEEQINHISDQLRNGQITVEDLQGEESMVQEKIQEAMSRIENGNDVQ